MSISSLILERICDLAIKAGLNPNDFSFTVDLEKPHRLFDVEFIYHPTDQHRGFKLYPFYESGAISEYMLKRQIVSQLSIFMEQVKPREEWPNDKSKLEGNQ